MAQSVRGIVLDADSQRPLADVTITNLATGLSGFTDSTGHFVMHASMGDRITANLNGYRPGSKFVTDWNPMQFELSAFSVRLPEYVLHDLTPFQRDSIELSQTYHKELTTQPVKVGFSNANGGGFSGLIGAPVQKMSRSYKRNKQFKENFRKDMEQKYIDTKYKPELVTNLTGLTGDTLILFMNSYPMDYNFARTASDLELKGWIRECFKDYVAKGHAVKPKG